MLGEPNYNVGLVFDYPCFRFYTVQCHVKALLQEMYVGVGSSPMSLDNTYIYITKGFLMIHHPVLVAIIQAHLDK